MRSVCSCGRELCVVATLVERMQKIRPVVRMRTRQWIWAGMCNLFSVYMLLHAYIFCLIPRKVGSGLFMFVAVIRRKCPDWSLSLMILSWRRQPWENTKPFSYLLLIFSCSGYTVSENVHHVSPWSHGSICQVSPANSPNLINSNMKRKSHLIWGNQPITSIINC